MMNNLTHTVRDGAYTLPPTDEPLLNPRADGRTRNDWRTAPTFEVGAYYVTTHERDEDCAAIISVRKGVYRSINITHRAEEKFAEFLDALVVDNSLDSLVHYYQSEHRVYPADVLMRLVEAGAVSDDAVRVALAAQRQVNRHLVDLEHAQLAAEYNAKRQADKEDAT